MKHEQSNRQESRVEKTVRASQVKSESRNLPYRALLLARSDSNQLYFKIMLDRRHLLPLPEKASLKELKKLMRAGSAEDELLKLIDGQADVFLFLSLLVVEKRSTR